MLLFCFAGATTTNTTQLNKQAHTISTYIDLCCSLNIFFTVAILDTLKVEHIDWLILDLEGSEVPILLSFPWERVTVDIVEVECRWCWKSDSPDFWKKTFYPEFFKLIDFNYVFEQGMDHIYARNQLLNSTWKKHASD